MEQYIVSARKYRPSTFASVVGQQALTATLKNAIATDRLAHAYLFCGSRGVGKTSCARIFAKTINCTNRTPDGEACNECDSCRQFNENRSLNIIELDAASNNGVDDIRELIDQVLVPPTDGKYRVFIIDEVHMLSTAAFNAFLKTLEEPPAHAIFILATTEKHKIIPTILSRCQIYDFNRISIRDMVAHLSMVAKAEGAQAEPAALNVIAQKADGAMRDALSIFDQVLASSRGNITYASAIENLNVLDHAYYSRLVDAFIEKDVPKALLIYKEVRDKGFDSQFFINGLAGYLRDLMVASDPSTIVLLEAGDEVRAEMAERAAKLTPDFLYRAMDLCNDADFNYRASTSKQLLIELTLIKLCQRLRPSTKRSGHVEGLLKPLDFGSAAAPAAAPRAPKVSATPRTTIPPAATAPAAAAATSFAPATAGTPSVPPRRPAGAPAHTLGATRLSLHRNPAAAQPAAATPTQDATAAATAPIPEANEKYDEKAFRDAWVEFIAANASEHILINAMRTAGISRSTDAATPDLWTITVDGEVPARAVSDAAVRINTHLRKSLSNTAVQIQVACNTGELSPKMWTDNQIFSHWLEHNPKFREFAEKFNLRLL